MPVEEVLVLVLVAGDTGVAGAVGWLTEPLRCPHTCLPLDLIAQVNWISNITQFSWHHGLNAIWSPNRGHHSQVSNSLWDQKLAQLHQLGLWCHPISSVWQLPQLSSWQWFVNQLLLGPGIASGQPGLHQVLHRLFNPFVVFLGEFMLHGKLCTIMLIHGLCIPLHKCHSRCCTNTIGPEHTFIMVICSIHKGLSMFLRWEHCYGAINMVVWWEMILCWLSTAKKALVAPERWGRVGVSLCTA